MNSKEFFLDSIGVHAPAHVMHHDLTLQRYNESKPFGAIITKKNGQTVLRVGENLDDVTGIKMLVR